MNHHTPTPTLAKRCRSSKDHELEHWCLFAAVTQGTWPTVHGMNFDRDNDGNTFAWKIMRCGCVAIVGPFPTWAAAS